MQIGNYKIIEKIGEGGMANVYLVQDPLGHHYALKELKPNLINDKIKVKRFHYESHVIKDFNCKNIIKIIEPTKRIIIYTGSKSYTSYFYVMEYMQNLSLKDMILKQKFTFDKIKKIFLDILNALDYSHARGIIHRDIKPANVLSRSKNNIECAVVTDYGIARLDTAINTDNRLTTEYTVIGTPAYLSPEQIRDSRQVYPQSDLYSAGIILYELVTGERPYKGHNQWEIMAQIKDPHFKPLPPSKIRPNISPKLENLILNLTEKDYKKRPKSAREVINYLADATTSGDFSAKSSYSFKKHLYSPKTIINIKAFEKKSIISTQNFNRLPIIIGRLDSGQTKIPIKFEIPPNFKSVSRTHCEIFYNEKNEVVLKDLSKFGTSVNNVILKRDICHLKTGINNITLANSINLRLEVSHQHKINKWLALFILLIIFILCSTAVYLYL